MSRRYPRSPPLVDTFTQHTRPVADAIMRGISDDSPSGSSDSKAAEAPAGNPADAGANPAPTTDTEDQPMKMQFASVTLLKTMPRLDAGRGQATQETTYFDAAKSGVAVEYDTATGLVRLSKGTAVAYVPREGVERFGPTLEEAAADSAARAEAAKRAAGAAQPA